MAPPSRTSFQPSWQTDFSWVRPSSRKGYAQCTLCRVDIFYESMGRTALKSHAKGKVHTERVGVATKTVPIQYYSRNTSANAPTTAVVEPLAAPPAAPSSSPANASSTTSNPVDRPVVFSAPQPTSTNVSPAERLKSFQISDAVTRAEALICLQTVATHSSLRTAESNVQVLKKIFEGNQIADDMKLGKDKVGYCINYGLGPYFRHELLDLIGSCEHIVIGFDECLNKIAQRQQMDLSIRFWNDINDRVCTRYLSSVFLDRTCASDLLNGMKDGLNNVNLLKIVQFSMDGPHVNLKLVRLFLKELRPDPELPGLLNLGTCSLHTTNVAFKAGISEAGWNLLPFFRAAYYLFKDSPARRGIYKSVAEPSASSSVNAATASSASSVLFPLKFTSIRFLENVDVAHRALLVIPILKKYMKKVQETKKEPTCASYQKVCYYIKDKLLPAKLAFFASLAEDFQKFLTDFQSDQPMAPFLYDSLVTITKRLMQRIVKTDVLDSTPIHKIDVSKKSGGQYVNLKDAKVVDLGYLTRQTLRDCKGLTQLEILKFREACRKCLISVVTKLLEKSPLKYPLTEALTFLDPSKISANKYSAIDNMTKALEIIMDTYILSARVIQDADREYRHLLSDQKVMTEMKSFNRHLRLDDFWVSILRKDHTPNLMKVVKLLLPLSHGNASLERGFSVNKELIVENLREDSLVAQRLVYDAITVSGGVLNVPLPKSLLLYMRNANCRWKQALEDRRKKLSAQETERAEKRKKLEEARELEAKKKKILEESSVEVAAIEEKIKTLRNP